MFTHEATETKYYFENTRRLREVWLDIPLTYQVPATVYQTEG